MIALLTLAVLANSPDAHGGKMDPATFILHHVSDGDEYEYGYGKRQVLSVVAAPRSAPVFPRFSFTNDCVKGCLERARRGWCPGRGVSVLPGRRRFFVQLGAGHETRDHMGPRRR